MPLISESIPNLINGVSQQPPSLRLKTQAEVQENGLSTVVDGLKKRPGTVNVGKLLNSGTATNAFIHTIRRDADELYTLVITSSNIYVFDQDGVARTVTGSATYLSGLTNPSKELTATSIADYTFIVNKNTTVLKDTTTSTVRPDEALVYCKQGDYETTYSVTIYYNGTSYTASYTTQDSSVASNQASVKTDNISQQLQNALNSNLPSYFTIVDYDSTFYIKRTDGGTFKIGASDSRGDTFLYAFKGQTKDFLDLPDKGELGFTIMIRGQSDDDEDDYYVELQDPTNSGQYVWKEVVEPGADIRIDASTMPHQLVKQTNGSFVFQEAPWEDRAAGDDNTNPFPSFIDNKLNDIFLHRNRLGFLSDENVIFSEAGEYYNFFQRTVFSLLDSARIDVAVSNNQVSILKHAVPFNKSLLIFSDLTQFNLQAQDLLTPASVSIDVATNFEASLRTKPATAGRFVFFPTQRGKWSGIREYFIEDSTESNANAVEITSHIPRYIEGEVTKMVASSNEDTLLILTEDDPQAVYINRYYWTGEQKVQNSWSRWTFDGDVLNVDFNQSDIFIVIERSDGIYLETINLSQDVATAITDGGWSCHLDRRVTLTSGGTTTVPYTDSNLTYITDKGDIIAAADVSAKLTAGRTVFAGIPFTFRYEFSELVVKEDNEPITIGRLQVRRMGVVYSNSGYFKAVITPTKRTSSEVVFTGRLVGASTNLLGKVPLATGTFKLPVLAKASEVKIELVSDSHLPCQFQSAEWEGYFVLRSKRR